MSSWMVVVTGLIYIAVCVEQAFKGNWPVALMFFAYGLANAGVYFQVR